MWMSGFGSDACNYNLFAYSAIIVAKKVSLNVLSPVRIHDWRRNIPPPFGKKLSTTQVR